MYIGIDLGTSAIKLALVANKDDKIVTINDVEKHQDVVVLHNDWSEQDPQVWYRLMLEGLTELTKNHKNIKGISFSGQMHGLVLLDKDDNVLRNAILWNDQRTSSQTEELISNLTAQAIYNETNNMMLTGFTAPKLLWVMQNEPDIYNKIDKIMLPKDYLVYKLTKVHATETTDISGSLFYDVKNNRYSKMIIDYLELKESQLPKVFKSTDYVGDLTQEITKELKLTGKTKIFAGGGDQAVGATLTNTFNEGDCSISLGTSGVVLTPITNIDNMKNNSLHCFRHVNNNFFLMGVTLSAAGSIQWFKDQFAKDISYEELYNNIETNNKNNVLFLPYLNGERTPINNPKAKGVLMNLTSQTKQSDMFKSVIEGVAFSLRSILEEMQNQGINIKQAAVIGGGTRNDKFTQILADVLGIKLYTLNKHMGAALGAAMIAMVGNKEFLDIQSIVKRDNKVLDYFIPNNSLNDYYKTKYESYNKLYKDLKDFFK